MKIICENGKNQFFHFCFDSVKNLTMFTELFGKLNGQPIKD